MDFWTLGMQTGGGREISWLLRLDFLHNHYGD